MDIRIRHVRRTWVERLFLWERAYEAQTERDHERIVERAKTAEAAEALVFKRMTDNDIQIEVRGDLIIVTQPTLHPVFCGLHQANKSAAANSEAPHRYRRPRAPCPSFASGECQGARAWMDCVKEPTRLS